MIPQSSQSSHSSHRTHHTHAHKHQPQIHYHDKPFKNPRDSSNVWSIIEPSKMGSTFQSLSGGGPSTQLSVTASKGLVGFYDNPVLGIKKGGASVDKWEHFLFNGVILNDVNMVELALMHSSCDINLLIKRNGNGAAYSFGSFGFFSNSQMEENIKFVNTNINKRIDDANLYVSKSDQSSIIQYINLAGTYAPAKANVKNVEHLDTVLLVAIRQGSFSVVKYLLSLSVNRCDLSLLNDKKEGLIDILKVELSDIIKERKYIKYLNVQKAHRALTKEEFVTTDRVETVNKVIIEVFDVCKLLNRLYMLRLKNVKELKRTRNVLAVTNTEIDDVSVYEIGNEGQYVKDKLEVNVVLNSLKNLVNEINITFKNKQKAIKAEHHHTHHHKHNLTSAEKTLYWQTSVYNKSIVIQSVFRGFQTRVYLYYLTLHLACVKIQALVRGGLARTNAQLLS